MQVGQPGWVLGQVCGGRRVADLTVGGATGARFVFILTSFNSKKSIKVEFFKNYSSLVVTTLVVKKLRL